MVSVWNLLFAAPALASAARLYGQCGGIGYRGSKNCPRGAACIEQSRSLHLCLPGNMATTTAPTTTALPTVTPVPPSEKYLITFGDSYSQTGFNVSLAPPSPANPLGNPPLPGWTASGGLNWVGFLASRYNATTLLTYNFAYGGATTNASLVAPWRPDVLSLVDQVAQFSASIASKPEHAKWTGENALFGVWIGVNDVGNSWWLEGYDGLVERIMDTYFGQLEILYGSGARRFVLLTVPPIHKTPAVLANPVEAQEAEKVSIDKYNTRVAERWEEFKRAREGVQGLVVDTTVPFEKALANPTAYRAADATCYNQDGVSCLWFNDYHPGVAINQLVAEAVAEAWKGVFFK